MLNFILLLTKHQDMIAQSRLNLDSTFTIFLVALVITFFMIVFIKKTNKRRKRIANHKFVEDFFKNLNQEKTI